MRPEATATFELPAATISSESPTRATRRRLAAAAVIEGYIRELAAATSPRPCRAAA
jgi:hypothetical protein